MSTPGTEATLRFSRFELQTHERRLLMDGSPVTLGGRAFDVLLVLAERAGQLVTKRALIDLVWPGMVVEENNLAAQVSALRKVVGDEVIATIPGRGYRFVARVASATPPQDAARTTGHATHRTPAPALRTNLPAELPLLLGRAADLAALDALIDSHRLVSIVGAGGMGKSLLTQHLLHARRGSYPHGVCWVELAEVTDAAALPGAVAAALGVECGPGEPLASLVSAVAPLTMLLGLDNAEHQLTGVANLCQALHDGAPGVRLVVTSQAPLGRTMEQVFRIGPLAVPDAALDATPALQFGAVALFAERAHATDGRFALTDANAAAVIEICRALDGVPLAIELAAARSHMLGMPRLLASMRDRLDVLTSNRNRAAPARQQTLRAALEWSHGFLQARERQVFRRLGVIAGSASLELVEYMLIDDELDRWAVLDVLDTLVDRSLVAVLSGEDGDEPRYRLLETPRAYALERLDEAGERPAAQRRHAEALAALFDAAYGEYFSGRIGADEWVRRLGADLDNARDALDWARAAGETTIELTIGSTLLRALPPSLHVERMMLADACARRIGDSLAEPLQCRAWMELSSAWADTQKPRSRAAAECALSLARKLDRPDGDRFQLYHALCRAASAATQAGDVQAARAPLRELQALEDPRWPAQRLLWGAEAAQVVARTDGDAVDALRRSRRLLALDSERGGDASIALGNLIDAELAAGDARGAAQSGAAHVAALRGTRHEYSLAYARLNLCAALLALGDCAHVRPIAQAAWPQAIVFELQHYGAGYLALLAALESRPRAAARLLGYAEAIYEARKETRETNEAVAMTRATVLSKAALGDAGFKAARAEGATLRDAEIGALAFATDDV
ncbi:MAG TPA: winged helix-turn-helix domain-containing protein [Burkholderiaceae bacterium]|nr:winged helix-turn-helix domain-containing protein [Burkholderiaceae bacterium]